MCCCACPVCNKQSEHTLWTSPEAHFLVMLNIAPLTLDQVWVGLWRSLFSVQNIKWTHLFFRPERPWAHKSVQIRAVQLIAWDSHAHLFSKAGTALAQMHLLFKQCGAGWENENCVGLKLAKTLAPHCAGCKIGPLSVQLNLSHFFEINEWFFKLCDLLWTISSSFF